MARGDIGQAGIEFMVVLGIILMVFMILGYILYQNYVKSNDLKIFIDGSRVSNSIADDINTLNAVGDGYSTRVRVPKTLYGERAYTINFYENESSVFVEGSAFSTGNALTFSAPISTDKIRCLINRCNDVCNTSASEQCLEVNDSLTIRLARSSGHIYLTQEDNIIQGGLRHHIAPFYGNNKLEISEPNEIIDGFTPLWNVIYVYHRIPDDTISLVFSINSTNNEKTKLYFHELMGDVVEASGNEKEEFSLYAGSGYPNGDWEAVYSPGSMDFDGAYINFRGGFHLCVTPDRTYMPSADWIFLNSDGMNITLDKQERVCLTYP